MEFGQKRKIKDKNNIDNRIMTKSSKKCAAKRNIIKARQRQPVILKSNIECLKDRSGNICKSFGGRNPQDLKTRKREYLGHTICTVNVMNFHNSYYKEKC